MGQDGAGAKGFPAFGQRRQAGATWLDL